MQANKLLKRNIYLLLAYHFFSAFIFAYAIERLFWQSRGIRILEIVYLEILFAIVVVVLEIPTGIIADRWKRKGLLFFAALFSTAEFLLLIFAQSFWGFAVAILAAAVSCAMASGATNALLYDTLTESGMSEQFAVWNARNRFAQQVALVIGLVLGGMIADRFGFLACYWQAAISCFLSLVIVSLLKEPTRAKQEDDASLISQLSAACKLMKNSPQLLPVLISGLGIGSLTIYMDEFWQLILSDHQISVFWFGFICAMFQLMLGLGALLANRTAKRISQKCRLLMVMPLVALLFTAFAYANAIMAVVAGSMLYFFSGPLETWVFTFLHEKAEASYRATAESLASMLQRIMTFVIGIAFGFVSETFSLQIGFVMLTVIGLFMSIGFAFFTKGIKRDLSSSNITVTDKAS